MGILGGSFDPPHLGHLILARDALEQLSLERVLLIPALQSPLREGSHVATFEQRLAMLQAMAANRPWLTVLDIERTLPQPSYSVVTARALRAQLPGVHLLWLIGADQLARLPQWRDPQDLVQLLEFAVAARPGHAPELPPIEGIRAQFLHTRSIDISSTELRQRLAKGLPIDHLVPAEVANIIHSQGIY